MTAPTNSNRRFSPTFVATITPGSVATRMGKNGKYVISQGSTITREGREPRTMTVMAFGNSRDAVKDLLRKGRPVDLAVQYDGGTLKIVGLPRGKAA